MNNGSFKQSQVINRELSKPNMMKILFSEYGNIKLYESSKKMKITSYINAILITLLTIPVVILVSLFFSQSFNYYIDSNQQLIATIICSLAIANGGVTLFFAFLGCFKKLHNLNKKKLSFDNLMSNIIIKVGTIVVIYLFIIDNLSLDSLIPVTSTELTLSNSLYNLIFSSSIILIVMVFLHFNLLFFTYYIKKEIIIVFLRELLIKASTSNDATIPDNLSSSVVNKIVFQRIKK